MSEYTYSIIMYTQLGPKVGTLRLTTAEEKIDGTMCVLEKEEAFTGELFEDGKCRLYGRIVTPMKPREYTADGYFNDERIELSLSLLSEQDRLRISGTASPWGHKKQERA